MTPDRAALEALIERLEKATEGSHELDAEIVIALCLPREVGIDDDGCEYERLGDGQHFTRSVDAALTLVPEGWDSQEIRQEPWWKDQPPCDATIHRNGHEHIPLIYVKRDKQSGLYVAQMGVEPGKVWGAFGQAETRPLALCIAALRARLAEMKEDDRD